MKNKQGAKPGSQHALKGEVPASEHIHVRVIPALKAAAKAKARTEGLTFSEWVIKTVSEALQE
jgi:predicted HicB family RNase H-like nuclease